jgi:hypothetical protein
VVLLSNEVVVTSAWLDQLLALAGVDPVIGAVGPMTNRAEAPQYVAAIPYHFRAATESDGGKWPDPWPFLDSVDRFASQYRQENRGKWCHAQALEPFCVLFKREALAALRPWDGLSGNKGSRFCAFDPMQVGFRMQQAGFRMAVCMDLFVHNFACRPTGVSGIRELSAGPMPR